MEFCAVLHNGKKENKTKKEGPREKDKNFSPNCLHAEL